MSASISFRSSCGSEAIFARTSPKPFCTSTPRSANKSPYFSNKGLKNAFTPCPKIIGSETFIIVAFKCNENRTPAVFAEATCSSKNSTNAFLLMNVPSRISPCCNARVSFKTIFPFEVSRTICTVVSFSIVTDCSFA